MTRYPIILCALLGLALTSCSSLPSPPTAWRTGPLAVSGGAALSEEDYRFQTRDGLTLMAKLTLPAGAKRPPPVVIFIGGSGTWDSDYTQLVEATRSAFVMPLPDLARRSAQAGLAFVRYQKRGVTDPGGQANAQWKTVRPAALMDDLRLLLAKVKADPRLDGSRIALVGHSEGTMLATWVGNSEDSVKAFVFMGLVRQNLKEVFRLQLVVRNGERIFAFADAQPIDARLDATEIASASQRGLNFKDWQTFDADRSGSLSKAEYLALLDQSYGAWVRAIEALKPEQLVPGDGNPAGWFQQHFRHQTVGEAWRQIRKPVLVVQGQADTNTPFETEAEPFDTMLGAQRHPDHRLIGLEGLDHWFKDREGQSQADKAFDLLVPWLKERL
jgi:pimeloyl-ACP methyl ester carboxylesterase